MENPIQRVVRPRSLCRRPHATDDPNNSRDLERTLDTDDRLLSVRLQATAEENCGPVTCKIKSLRIYEPIRRLGVGDTSPDWFVIGDLALKLRAERSAKGAGRIHAVTAEARDTPGNTSTSDVKVTMPYPRTKGDRHGAGVRRNAGKAKAATPRWGAAFSGAAAHSN